MSKSLAVKPADSPLSNRTFGLILGSMGTVIALWPLLHAKPLRMAVLIPAAVLLGLGLALPSLLYWPKTIWIAVTHRISRVVNYGLMAVLFFGVVTPLAIVFRLIGRDALALKLNPQAPSYWKKREVAPAETHFDHPF